MQTRHIGIIGGGPAALFMFKRIIAAKRKDVTISIFEKNDKLGAGLPYSDLGANPEHVTNVSGNEIPEIHSSVREWLSTCPASLLKMYGIDLEKYSDYKVLPRLLFGRYLSDQFKMYLDESAKFGLKTNVHLNTNVENVIPTADKKYSVITNHGDYPVDELVICTGHYWPKKKALPDNFFDSPYPPSKLLIRTNHPVALKGASLTAIDAIRTLARHNGKFTDDNGKLSYKVDKESNHFKIVMHSRNGLLPAVRFHLDDPHLFRQPVLTEEELAAHRLANDNFISLDFIFEKNYKDLFIEKDPELYNKIKDLSLEGFVDMIMKSRENIDPFDLLKAEYDEAEKSMKRHESVIWKELLAVLSFTMNPPAKYFSAEDMIRLQSVLMPLISIVIAFIPQSSCKELLALHDAGILEFVTVGFDNSMEPHPKGGAIITYKDEHGNEKETHFKTFVDCTGQPHLPYEDFPFNGLLESKSLRRALLRFASHEKAQEYALQHPDNIVRTEGEIFLKVPGVAINDHFQAADEYGAYIENLYVMAVSHLGGYNPDYSGLDFCEAASEKIAEVLLQ
ncbi:MAG: hypothetical protein EOO50_05750 [Flavobacterium sp.]|uniref:FAD/NAD(P)-binding protein n=1 Tax=Flavobacterium sp. TaxID=239 RepID=UPI0011F9BD9F|nr:FAD/NAD(P)-binding protein [Flavobacterium sp.]RZJ67489.1 MAG: hypothetical protein EOO50_05750 [Flavobacterium sp.]